MAYCSGVSRENSNLGLVALRDRIGVGWRGSRCHRDPHCPCSTDSACHPLKLSRTRRSRPATAAGPPHDIGSVVSGGHGGTDHSIGADTSDCAAFQPVARGALQGAVFSEVAGSGVSCCGRCQRIGVAGSRGRRVTESLVMMRATQSYSGQTMAASTRPPGGPKAAAEKHGQRVSR
jgi:hypothetical protein